MKMGVERGGNCEDIGKETVGRERKKIGLLPEDDERNYRQ